MFFDKYINELRYRTLKLLPFNNSENLIISTMGAGENKQFSCLMHNLTPEFKTLYNAQNFPYYIYQNDEKLNNEDNLFNNFQDNSFREENILDELKIKLEKFYNKNITKKQIFYYIYGILHSSDYSEVFKNNLNKEIPRIPFVKNVNKFFDFQHKGELLSGYHVNFLKVKKFNVKIKFTKDNLPKNKLFYVTKMKHPKVNGKRDYSKIIYNEYVNIENIPLEAYSYKVNEKSPIEWVMDQQSISKDEVTGITDDPNIFANETMKNPAYPLELLQKVITVSLETQKLVKSLPKLDI